MADVKDIMASSEKPYDPERDLSSRGTAQPEVDDRSDAMSVRDEALGTDLPDNYFYSFGFIMNMTAFCLASISAYIFLLFPTTILTYINADIGPSALISWANVGRTLGLSFTYTMLGRLSDIFGRRWFFVGGNLIAVIGIVVCSTAQNVNTLIVGNTIYGIGETTQLSFNVAIGELVPKKHRPIVLSIIFAVSAPIAGLGSIIARAIYSNPNLGWRWTYHINTIVAGLATVLLFFFYHPPTFTLLHERKTKRQILGQLDYVGSFLWISGLTIFLIGISVGGSIYPWKSAPTIATIVIGILLLVALFVWESYANLEYPAIPVKFFRNRGFIANVMCATVATMFYYSAVLLWPQAVTLMYGAGVTRGGYLSATVGSATAIGQIAAGFILKAGLNARYILIFSSVAMVASVASLAALNPHNINVGVALTLIGPFFAGVIELLSLALAPLFCKPEDIGLASGLLASIRSAGGSIAVTVYVAILGARETVTIPANVIPAAVNAGLPEDQAAPFLKAVLAGTAAKFPGVTTAVLDAVKVALPIAYSQAFRTVYLASLGFGAIAITGGLISKDAKKYLNEDIDRKMHNVMGAKKDVKGSETM